jgi:hypothetical protein
LVHCVSSAAKWSPQVPWGDEGILLAIGGGTNETFSQMNVIDVYSLGNRKWTKQSTDGPSPKYRVNPCAAVASAPDGSSHQIYFFGGQNLVPYAEQLQYDDMYILTIPAFQWIKVDMSNQSIPPARAGHTCDIVGRQLIMIGGFTSTELSCDSPGVYVFDATTLEWTTGYSATAGGFSKNNKDRPYKVPQAVIDIIGGDKNGGATITKPVKTAVPDSPMVTGDAGDYKYTTFVPWTTIAVSTAPDGTVTTSTITPDPEVAPGGGAAGPDVGAVVGGVVGGIIALVLLILGGAFWLYKRKIRQLRESATMKLPVAGYSDKMGEDVMVGRNTATTTAGSSLDLEGEPTFWGVLLSPRRSLRVVNN